MYLHISIHPMNHLPYYWLVCMLWLAACQSKKPATLQTVQVKNDSVQLKTNASVGDTTHMNIPSPQKWVNVKSALLTRWINTYLVKETDSLAWHPSMDLLAIIGVQPTEQFRPITNGIYFQSTLHPNKYVVGIQSYCEEGDPILVVFAIDKPNTMLVKFQTYFGRACIGNEAVDAGELESFSTAGPYFSIEMYHGSYGMESMVMWWINDELEEVGGFPLVEMGGEELGNGRYTQYEWNYVYHFSHDTLIRHCELRGDNGKTTFTEELDILYKTYPDSVHCLQPHQRNKHNAIIERMQ
jgi:hypothetical protein